MNEQELLELEKSMHSLDALINQIYEGLDGQKITVAALTEAISVICPDIPMEILVSDCEDMLYGIQNGSSYAQRLMEMPEEALENELPECLQEAMEDLSEDEKHQYLILVYQFLYEKMDRPLSAENAILMANATNEELMDEIVYQMRFATVEVMRDTAEIVDHCAQRLQDREGNPAAAQYTQEERTWVLAAAMYAQARKNHPEEIPAVLIGETVGLSAATGYEFRNRMLSEVIPSAVAVLAVAATCALAFLCIKALVTHSLFATVLTWAKQHFSMTMIQYGIVMGTLAVGDPLLQKVWDASFSATVALTCRFMKENSREQFYRSYETKMTPIVAVAGVQTEEPVYMSDAQEDKEQEEYL